ncbi:arsenic transporter [Occallatibacter savannae]|uniref:arsenic transporter n=1 Tax=Occallatibacter savannae TaxID=1002691 RepID=UPI000D68DE8C|nr:arsenic transporter [Occallatibacter savannae]
MLIRPLKLPEVVWVGAGAILLCALHLIPLNLAGKAVAEGLDVYLFLTGMMLLSELGRDHGVFDWLASIAVTRANGSAGLLFTLIYLVGTVVTIFMSNDATAVVLTPAVLTAVKRAKARPMPYLLACALIANAASFVLPISNPANLVVFHANMPPLARWLAMFTLPSIASIVITYFLLQWLSRSELEVPCDTATEISPLSPVGRTCLVGIILTAAVLIVASALKLDLGLPTCLAAVVVAVVATIQSRTNPFRLVREVSWSVLPLVAALFVIVEAVNTAGATQLLRASLERVMQLPPSQAAYGVGAAVAFGTDLFNNLPLGLITGSTLRTIPFQPLFAKIVLIAIDLGPNLSITGSLATILWLIAIRREGLHISGWQFFRIGMLVMPISLLFAIAAALFT